MSEIGFISAGASKGWVNQQLEGYRQIVSNEIGVPGEAGFGVGVCPAASLPDGFVPIAGYTEESGNNYGNYQFSDGSITCYVPRFYYKIGTGSNGFAVNIVDIKPWDYFDSTATAEVNGYALPRAFIDGGDEQLGVFVDKYMCSKNALGTGYIASSIADGLPLSTSSSHNPVADLTNCAGNYYYEAINAAKARDGENGAAAADPQWFCNSKFIVSMLGILSLAHGQASSSTTNCGWYDATYNYPKGCNDNALGDTDDGTVSFTSDGYSNCGKTGSGTPFAKTTHNGQACGVADMNGLMWEVNIGVTCVAVAKNIEDISRADPANVQITAHGYSTGDFAMILSTSTGDWESLDDKIYQITVVDANNFTLDGVDTSAFSAAYVQGTNGGNVTVGTFYTAKEATAMKDFTSGNSLATDHWGATGVAAMMDEFDMMFETGYPNNGFSQRMGSGANQVLSEVIDGNPATLTSLGVPKDVGGLDTTGTNLFGKDYFYQYIRNELCVLSAGPWYHGSSAGVWGSGWHGPRSTSSDYVGFRCACYPV